MLGYRHRESKEREREKVVHVRKLQYICEKKLFASFEGCERFVEADSWRASALLGCRHKESKEMERK